MCFIFKHLKYQVTLLVLLLLLSLLLLETVWSWKANSPEHDEKSLSWPENVVLLKSALVNFKDGCSYLDENIYCLEDCFFSRAPSRSFGPYHPGAMPRFPEVA